jgi:S-adenosylmethionine synthetase
MSYLFSSESVSEGHPDKVADQISDALLDQFLAYDPESHCAIETFDTTGQVVIMGEVRSKEYIDLQTIARKTINRIGYTKAEYQFDGNSCGILAAIHEQSDDINRGVSREEEENQGAGDQGMMFGYACNETENYMPVTLDLAHIIMRVLADIRKEGKEMTYLRPDSKSQVTIEYSDDNIPQRIDTIVVSTQHDQFMDDDEAMLAKIKEDVLNILMPRVKAQLSDKVLSLFNDDIKYFVNPTGKFVIGGPHGDTGLTGRKIIVDTYGGKGAHGGGAFSGKDPSKVDRSAAYAARYIAKNMVAAGVADEMLVQLAYAIGVAEPVSVFVDT